MLLTSAISLRAAVDEVAQLQYLGANGLAHSGDQSLGNLAGHLSSVNRPPSTVPHGLLQAGRHFDQVIPAAGTTALFQSLGDGTDACRRVVRPVHEEGLAVLAERKGIGVNRRGVPTPIGALSY